MRTNIDVEHAVGALCERDGRGAAGIAVLVQGRERRAGRAPGFVERRALSGDKRRGVHIHRKRFRCVYPCVREGGGCAALVQEPSLTS